MTKIWAHVLLAAGVIGCSTSPGASVPRTIQPGTPGEVSRAPATPLGTQSGQRGYTEADVRFIQRMVPHHAQALTMTSLVPSRSRREDIRLLAERIAISQQDEIAQMQRWLRSRGEQVPSPDAHHEHHAAGGNHASMAGMLTPQELDRLSKASGPEFERLFLEFMIRHHEGALVMVEELFATPGAGQQTEIYHIATEVDADQRAEIARMRRMQNAPPGGATRTR